MKVIDSSVFVAALADSTPGGDQVRRAVEGVDLAAPELIDVEVLSALRGLVAAGQLDSDVASRSVIRLGRAPIDRHPHAPLTSRCWELRHNLTPYDAVYVALAENLDAPLLTADARLTRATGPRCDFELLQ